MAAPGVRPVRIFTVGHSTVPIREFLSRLAAAGIERVVDIRTIPRSRHNPQYDRSVLPGELGAAGIAYEHAPALGGLRRPASASTNLGWRNAAFRGYADYMGTPTFARAIEALIEGSRSVATAILCAEAVPWRCHRSLVADALSVRGVEALHLIGDRPGVPHRLTPFAVVDGFQVRYPAGAVARHPIEEFGPTGRTDSHDRPGEPGATGGAAASSRVPRRRRPPRSSAA